MAHCSGAPSLSKILLFPIHASEGCVTALYHRQKCSTQFIDLIKGLEQFFIFPFFWRAKPHFSFLHSPPQSLFPV